LNGVERAGPHVARPVAEAERVTVRCRLGGMANPDGRARAGHVLDDNGLSQRRAQPTMSTSSAPPGFFLGSTMTWTSPSQKVRSADIMAALTCGSLHLSVPGRTFGIADIAICPLCTNRVLTRHSK